MSGAGELRGTDANGWPTKRALRHLFSRHQALKITDIEHGDPDEVQITFKLKAGWGWGDFL